jgi:hypothetical protein
MVGFAGIALAVYIFGRGHSDTAWARRNDWLWVVVVVLISAQISFWG